MQTRLKKGDRIRLLSMPQDPDPIPVGSLGTVVAVHDHRDWAQVMSTGTTARSLMLTMPDDCVAMSNPTTTNHRSKETNLCPHEQRLPASRKTGRYAAIYLHFDGYHDHAGRVLRTLHIDRVGANFGRRRRYSFAR